LSQRISAQEFFSVSGGNAVQAASDTQNFAIGDGPFDKSVAAEIRSLDHACNVGNCKDAAGRIQELLRQSVHHETL
jgi:hypothetical protein